MQIDLETAQRLLPEANDFVTGKQRYMPEDSEIRDIAVATFHVGFTSHLHAVCSEIFRVVAIAWLLKQQQDENNDDY